MRTIQFSAACLFALCVDAVHAASQTDPQPWILRDTPQSLLDLGQQAVANEKSFLDGIIKTVTTQNASFRNTVAAYWQNNNHIRQQIAKLDLYASIGDYPSLKDPATTASNAVSKAFDNSFTNKGFFELVNVVYHQYTTPGSSQNSDQAKGKRDPPTLDVEDHKILQLTWDLFSTNGLALSAAKRNRLSQVLNSIQDLGNQYLNAQNNITGPTLYFTQKELIGIDDQRLAQLAKSNGKQGEKYGVSIYDGDLATSCKNGTTRQLVWFLDDQLLPDNVDRLKQLVALRAEQAQLLGYPTYAAYALRDTLVKTSQNVQSFVDNLASKIQPLNQKQYIDVLKGFKKKEEGDSRFFFEWDQYHYEAEASAAGVKKRDTQAQDQSQWFEAIKTIDGMLELLGEVFNFRFTKVDPNTVRPGQPAGNIVWDASVELFAVHDSTNKNFVGYLYIDPFYRNGDAAVSSTAYTAAPGSSYLRPDGTSNPIVVVLKLMLSSGDAGQPTLLSSDTIHLAYRLLGSVVQAYASKTKYDALSGIRDNIPDDFTNIIGSTFESWASNPMALARLSQHWSYASPQALAAWQKANPGQKQPPEKLQLGKGGSGPSSFQNGHNVAFALFSAANSAWDQNLYTQKHPVDTRSLDIIRSFNNINKKYRQLNQIDDLGVTDTSKWDFAFATNTLPVQTPATIYAYSYSWVYAADLSSAFANDPFNSQLGQKFRDVLLAPGGTKDFEAQIELYLGRKVDMGKYYKTLGA